MRLCLFLLGITVFTQDAICQLKADFTANTTNNCAPVVTKFTDASSGNPTHWKWNLGNGTISTQQNPSIIYFNPGTYTIKLVITNASETDSVVKTNYITVYNKPVVAFAATPSLGCAPFVVQFTDSSIAGSGNLTSWIWDFGDGHTDSVKNPQHIYTDENVFGVVLTVKNNFGCKQTFAKSKIIASEQVSAAFSSNYINTCQPPTPVTFTNSSSPASLNYKWSFGDGKSSSQASPVYTYDSTGNYQVQLVATNANGCADTSIQNISIGTVIPDFTFNSSCLNQITTFTNLSTPAPLSVLWSFGDSTNATSVNATHLYTATGTYKITMSTDFGNCKISKTKTIIITDKPIIAFTATGSVIQCAVPATVQFNTSTSGATTYQWSFGDNSTATATNPSHEYTKSGIFDVTLIATGAGGCSNTMTQKKLVNLGPPNITSIQNLPFAGCLGNNIQMLPVIISPETIASYAWNFGDGFISSDSTAQHIYSVAGNYTISLKVTTSEGCTNIFTSTATVSALPVANFIQTPTNACADKPVQFTDKSTGTIVTWLWDFGDNTTSSLQNPLHNFTDTGKFIVTLTVSNNSCKSVYKGDTLFIYPPIAAFKVANQCQLPFIKGFTDVSLGALTRLWNFGDGVTDSNTPNPQHTYSTPGIYKVTLLVTNGVCTSTEIKTINVVDQNPSFKTTPINPVLCKYSSVKFQTTNYDPLQISSYYWDFGDTILAPFNGSDSVIFHQYNDFGTFSPILITQDILGCKDTVSGLVSLTVFGPKAVFSLDKTGTCVKNIVPFTDKSTSDGTNNIVNWIWDYGDGKSDTLSTSPFQHTYDSAGTFSIRLKVIDSYGCSDSVGGPKIIINNPLASFSISDSTRCTNNIIAFTNLSTGGVFVNSWDFGNGITSVLQSPVYTYINDGIYTVKLTITDQFGCTDSITKSNIITISNPVASFDLADTFATCPPLVIHPLNTSHNYQTGSDIWQFDDGNTSSLADPVHTFTNGGIYLLTLVVKGFGQCYDTASKTVILHGSSGILSYPILAGCQPASVKISAVIKNSQYRTWDFGDGVVETNTDSSVSHTYAAYGLYRPKLLLSDTSGCVLTVLNKDTIHVSGIVAGFSTIQQTDCDYSYIDFSDSSKAYFGSISSYSWKFGDSSVGSTLPNKRYQYLRSGNYLVSHTVQSLEGCKDSLTNIVAVVVHSRPNLVITTVDSSCMSSAVQFNVKDTSAVGSKISSWQWDFGDDDGTDNVEQPLYIFDESGNFNVRVAGTNNDGCLGLASHEMEVLPLPLIDIGLDTSLCMGQSITLHPKGAASYTWINQPSLSCDQCIDPIAHPLLTTRYYVTGTTLGCQAKDSILIKVKMPVRLMLSPSDSLCVGESVQLYATGGDYYHWIPASGLSNSIIANPLAKPSITTTYTLIASDEMNCFSDTGKVKVTVFAKPVFNIIDSNITMTLGYSQLLRTYSEDIIRWEWTPSRGLDCSNCAEPNTNTGSSIVYTANAYNRQGCMTSDHVTVNVFCTGANVFIPNTFSPNGNGMNERFYPRGIGLFDISSFQIYNNYGVLVFEKRCMTPNAAMDGWDGTYKGQPAQTGVYVYVMSVMCKNNTVFKIKGNVTLIR